MTQIKTFFRISFIFKLDSHIKMNVDTAFVSVSDPCNTSVISIGKKTKLGIWKYLNQVVLH